jgi:formate dehydrogenase iron-sulfur subunit
LALDGSAGLLTLVEPPGIGRVYGANIGLVESFLKEQGDLSAVQRFAQFHEDVDEPLQGRYYFALLRSQAPGPGQQLAFEVDLDRCSGCKACVAACHNLNGLDEGESWRDVGLMVGGSIELPVLQHVTSSCHHCLDPACSSACPVNAYEKDPETGIVRHLDDQCIGCQYCTLACPYDAPKYNSEKGIVRKCDMCSARLAVGEAPACVQACPHEAIRIRVVDIADVAARAEEGAFLPSAADPANTRPTTYFLTSYWPGAGDARPADAHGLEPEHPHWPLIVMLCLTQLSVGGFVLEFGGRVGGMTEFGGLRLHTLLSLAFGWVGLGASVLHLGRPLYAYRAVIGVKHSWLSREVVAFGLFATLATVYAASMIFFPNAIAALPRTRTILLGLIVAGGLAGVGCSVLVYHVVRRPSWRAAYCGLKFAGTTAVLGLALALASLAIASIAQSPTVRSTSYSSRLVAIALSLMVMSSAKLLYEARLGRSFATSCDDTLRKSYLILVGPLHRLAGLRRLLGVVGGVALPAFVAVGTATAHPTLTALGAVLALTVAICGELAERYLFFAAVVKPKMPGGLMQ